MDIHIETESVQESHILGIVQSHASPFAYSQEYWTLIGVPRDDQQTDHVVSKLFGCSKIQKMIKLGINCNTFKGNKYFAMKELLEYGIRVENHFLI